MLVCCVSVYVCSACTVSMLLSAGLNTMGLYRVGGINSKVQKLMTTVFCKLHHSTQLIPASRTRQTNV